MIAFHHLFPELARREVRTASLRGHDLLPDDSYAFLEHYCADPGCDCRRVLLHVICPGAGAPLAAISHGFDDAAPGSELPRTFLDPLGPQTAAAKTLLVLFRENILDDPYRERLLQHYHMVKEAAADPGHPAHEAIRAIGRAAPQTVRQKGDRIGRNDPCPCGSGKKWKRCCRDAGTAPP